MRLLHRIVRWSAFAVVGLAAAGMTSWSLYTVAHDIYAVPDVLAAVTAAVFDGTALACLYLASEAIREGRSAAGPRLATFGLSGVSIYLNGVHADHINGGPGSFLMFAAPTVALLLLADLAWSAARARRRAADGERPVSLPRFGGWGWLLAREEAWAATKTRAVQHVQNGPDGIRTASGPRPDRPRSASEALRDHFAAMDPAEAIRIAASARPGATTADIAEELGVYGVHVTAVQVALVLGHRPAQVRIERPEESGSRPDPTLPPAGTPVLTSTDGHPDGSGHRPDTVLEAVRMITSTGVTDPVTVAAEASRLLGRTVRQETVRRYIGGRSRPADGIGQGGGGYA